MQTGIVSFAWKYGCSCWNTSSLSMFCLISPPTPPPLPGFWQFWGLYLCYMCPYDLMWVGISGKKPQNINALLKAREWTRPIDLPSKINFSITKDHRFPKVFPAGIYQELNIIRAYILQGGIQIFFSFHFLRDSLTDDILPSCISHECRKAYTEPEKLGGSKYLCLWWTE